MKFKLIVYWSGKINYLIVLGMSNRKIENKKIFELTILNFGLQLIFTKNEISNSN